MKNNEIFEHAAATLRTSLEVLALATIKQSDVPQVVQFVRSQVSNLNVPKDKVVHWDNAKLELLTAVTTELHRHVLLIGREVNRIRSGQRKQMKNFVKEAQRTEEMNILLSKRKVEDEAYKRTKE